jgi:FkbM family methyltransferase
MIVKDESHVIEESLEKLCDKINFDYWVISDTGSSDNTPELIKNFFEKKKIKGELYFDAWRDFGHNRSLAIERAFDKTDYLLVFDADDEIEGDLILPELIHDGYQLKIGRKHEYTYDRTLLVNNRKRWKFVGVLHEIIQCQDPNHIIVMMPGDYCVVSGRKGSRNKDPNKYYKDGIILEKAFLDAITNNEHIAVRYCFYCANSFFDAHHYEKAIDWYKRYLKIGNWNQEKYVSCRNMYTAHERLNKKEEGFFYLMEAFSYDRERMECLWPLVAHYSQQSQHDIIWNLYNIVKDFYENKYLSYDFSHKLFYDASKGDLHVPYFVIIAALNLKKYDTAIKMYEIIFTKKSVHFAEDTIKYILHNFQFCLESIQDNKKYFSELFEEYLSFLKQHNFLLDDYMDYITKYQIFFKNTAIYLKNAQNKPNLLFLTGFLNTRWNYTYCMNNALGGSETAAALLSKQLSRDYNVYIVGDVNEESVDGMHYVNNGNLKQLINTVSFETTIISRFLIYLETIEKIKTHHVYIWAHDFELVPNGTNLAANQLLEKYNQRINGCICLTSWHKKLFEQQYPILKNKIHIINNGISADLFNDININNKVKNQFIFTSRSERGLFRLLELWGDITKKIPDARLVISSYKDFPTDNDDKKIEEMIKNYSNVEHYGKLNKKDLYDLMEKSEYWFYPCTYPETSCITAMEMMMSKVICIYYPLAGLIDTIGNNGIIVKQNNEIETIEKTVNLSKEDKEKICTNGMQYVKTCTWNNRGDTWKKLILNIDPLKMHLLNLYNSESNIPPKPHMDYLAKMKNDGAEPDIIYDIGACTVGWTKGAKNFWSNAKYILFDGFEDVEFLYKKENYDYNIGILSEEDNKEVKWYENKTIPTGNSYYKENNNEVFPEDNYKVRMTETLNTVVNKRKFPLPDLVKIDVQGCEKDIIIGGKNIIKHAKHLIVEMQHADYNKNAPKFNEVIPVIESMGFELVTQLFCNNGPDGDYHFINKSKV